MRRLLLAALFLVGVPGDGPSGEPQRPPQSDRVVRIFLDRHWQRPIAPQGTPPARFSPIERSLAPASCGTCHPAQLADWKTSLHAASMGPGVTGQLVEMRRTDPDTARSCLSCHAPLAEQS